MSEEWKPMSDKERFMRYMADFADFGEWRFREAAAYGYVSPIVAKLSGCNGHVEVWGGRSHRTEVWFLGKDKSERLVAVGCDNPDDMRLAIAEACNLAGIQGRLELDDA